MNIKTLAHITFSCLWLIVHGFTQPITLLNFSKNTGFDHTDSRPAAVALVEELGTQNGWDVTTSEETGEFTDENLQKYDAVIWNNNCVIGGEALSEAEQTAYENYLRTGGAHVAIHCGGAVWGSGTPDNPDWPFYRDEIMAGATVIGHPAGTPQADIVVENRNHISSRHLPKIWTVNDEWYHYTGNPREKATVVFNLDETSYDPGGTAMGDHPVAWYHTNLGGRVIFTGMGHTVEMYSEENFRNHVEGIIKWAVRDTTPLGTESGTALFILPDSNITLEGLVLDLDANRGVEANGEGRVMNWVNQSPNSIARNFDTPTSRTDEGRPTLLENVPSLFGGSALSFREEDLVNMEEDAFDHLNLGSGYTWLAVMKIYQQQADGSGLADVNSFFGNLKNSDGYEGIWGGLDDDGSPWIGTRKNITDRWNEDNPKVEWTTPLEVDQYYIVAGRMGSGTGTVNVELFVDDINPKDVQPFTLDLTNDPSRMAVGTERDATNHPGHESFDGEIARLLIYERPLSDEDLQKTMDGLRATHLTEPVSIKRFRNLDLNPEKIFNVYRLDGKALDRDHRQLDRINRIEVNWKN